MPIVAIRPPTCRARPTDHLARGVTQGFFEVLVDGGVVEAAVAVGAVAAEVVFVAEFAVGDAVVEVALGGWGGGVEGGIDALVGAVLVWGKREGVLVECLSLKGGRSGFMVC